MWCLAMRPCGFMAVLCGYVAICPYGYIVIWWLCRHMVIWLYGYNMAILNSVHITLVVDAYKCPGPCAPYYAVWLSILHLHFSWGATEHQGSVWGQFRPPTKHFEVFCVRVYCSCSAWWSSIDLVFDRPRANGCVIGPTPFLAIDFHFPQNKALVMSGVFFLLQ